ncbi:MAG: F0F1 ATP synthase subunit A [Patescibacteria group bacterium]
MSQPHISLAAEKVTSLFGLPITNSIIMTWVVMLALIAFAWGATRKLSLIPSTLQGMAEVTVEGLYKLYSSVVGDKHIVTFFPLLASIFLFIVVANWSGLLPGVGTIGIRETTQVKVVETEGLVETEEAKNTVPAEHTTKLIPLLRGPTADLNTTLALAVIAVIMIQYYGVHTLGLAYFKKYLNFSDPIMFGVGLLEIVSEISRIVSFAFRLFGNIFAGEVLLTVIAFLMPLVAPLPFLGLELFVGFVQALVFSMLTAVFLSMATVSHEGH